MFIQWLEWCGAGERRIQRRDKVFEKKKYEYFLAYRLFKNDKEGIGNTVCMLNCKINTEKVIRDVEKYLMNEFNTDHLVLVNFILLSKQRR